MGIAAEEGRIDHRYLDRGNGDRGHTQHEKAQRKALRIHVGARRAELEETVLTRVRAIANPAAVDDQAYVDGLCNAVSAAIAYALEAIELGEQRMAPPPPALLVQARLAARCGVGLDTVLRRYMAGYTLVGDYVAREAERAGLPQGMALFLPGWAAVFDRLLTAVSEEYQREVQSRTPSRERRRAERIERLLAGVPLDTSDLSYRFDGHHLGLVADGPDAPELLRWLAESLGCRLLKVRRAESGVLWAWLGRGRPIRAGDARGLAVESRLSRFSVAIGEPGAGLSGWRLSHRQARAALPIANANPGEVVHYLDHALFLSVLADDLLSASLREAYLAPLEADRHHGSTLAATLRAYFQAEQNISSAAVALGVNRQTVASRLTAFQRRLGDHRSINSPEMQMALRLREFTPKGDIVSV